jgi:transcriptional regulator with XRE-family HTH domain
MDNMRPKDVTCAHWCYGGGHEQQGGIVSAKTREAIGARLRYIRQEKDMTLDELATAASIDKGFLSRLERGTKQPSIDTVLRLSAALEVPIGQLFGERTAEDIVRISRSAGRPQSQETGGYSFALLTPKGGLMDAFLFEVGTELTGSGQQHDGEELFYVLAGTVEMRTPDRSYVLEVGDCAYFPGHLSHSMRRIGSTPATAIIAVARERSSIWRDQARAVEPRSDDAGDTMRSDN